MQLQNKIGMTDALLVVPFVNTYSMRSMVHSCGLEQIMILHNFINRLHYSSDEHKNDTGDYRVLVKIKLFGGTHHSLKICNLVILYPCCLYFLGKCILMIVCMVKTFCFRSTRRQYPAFTWQIMNSFQLWMNVASEGIT